MAKKYEKFELANTKGHTLGQDEEEKKESLRKSLEDHIEIFELYKKHHGDKENEDVHKPKGKSVVEKHLQSENKVVECSILTDRHQVQTASKEI